MNFPQALVVLAMGIAMTGCESQSTMPPAHYQRFVPIPADGFFVEGVPWHGFFALDTKTGTLCVTLQTKAFPKDVSEWANGVPKCNDIWRNDQH